VQRLGLGRGLPFRLGGIAGDQAEALNAGAQAVATQNLEHTTGRNHDAAPHWQGQLGCDSTRTQAWMAEREADDSLLDPGR